ncbi:hypothetical protein GCM10017783_10780 [Deinococcus piscis]|uniref:Uncharacterized protein n=2 Tax=Deinococcus piscis TaxID=394230 RepID=A0ABQ3K3G9_9DEIO|nr:hypothetical protein GCM10017783_10780 [Deinococcus piscis]
MVAAQNTAPALPRTSFGGATRWNAATLQPSQAAFELKAPAGTGVTLTQVGSTVFELSGLEVSGLGNAGNAALEQQLRANFQALDALGESQSRTVSLQVLSRSPAGTELITRWSDTPGTGTSTPAQEVQLRQLLLPGGVRGPVEVSSPDPALAARYRLLGSAELESLSPEAAAPYGTVLEAGDRVSGLSQQPVLPLFRAALGVAPALRDWALPDLSSAEVSSAELPALEVRRERVYQGQNSRGDFLFQTQSRAQPWQQTVQGPAGIPAPDAGRSSLTLEVLDMAQMSQAVYRADGLPHSAFEFSTLQLQVTARRGAATVRFTVQVRSTSALRPLGN